MVKVNSHPDPATCVLPATTSCSPNQCPPVPTRDSPQPPQAWPQSPALLFVLIRKKNPIEALWAGWGPEPELLVCSSAILSKAKQRSHPPNPKKPVPHRAQPCQEPGSSSAARHGGCSGPSRTGNVKAASLPLLYILQQRAPHIPPAAVWIHHAGIILRLTWVLPLCYSRSGFTPLSTLAGLCAGQPVRRQRGLPRQH